MKLIKLKCQGCGAVIKLNNGMKEVTCDYCGNTYLVDDEVERLEITKNYHKTFTDEAKIKENELNIKKMELREKEKKRNAIIILVIVLSLVFLSFSSHLFYFFEELYYQYESKPKKNQIQVPMSFDKYVGEDYQVVVRQLEDAGFENIKSQPIYDLVVGLVTKNGEVESVSIAGDKEFLEGDIFDKDSQVLVTYHAFKKEKK